MAKKPATIQGEKRGKNVLTIVFAVVAIVYLLPIFLVLMNSFKANAYVNTETFAMPNEESFVGFGNYVKGMTFGNYPFAKSVGYWGSCCSVFIGSILWSGLPTLSSAVTWKWPVMSEPSREWMTGSERTTPAPCFCAPHRRAAFRYAR